MRCAVIACFWLMMGSGIADAKVVYGAPHRAADQPRRGWMAPDANPNHAWLYVVGYDNNVVVIHDLDRIGFPEIGEITDGVSTPVGVTVDGKGNVYVGNTGSGTLTIYPPGSTTPSVTLSEGLTTPTCAAIDAGGNIWVANRGSAPSITVFPPGQTAPSFIITSPLISDVVEDFFDSSGNLVFGDFSSGMNMIPAGSQQPVSLGHQNETHSQGTMEDPTTGDLFVDTYPGPRSRHNIVYVYKPGQTAPSRRLHTTLSANGIATGSIKGKQYMFTTGWETNQVVMFRSMDSTPVAYISTAAQSTAGVAFKPAGVL